MRFRHAVVLAFVGLWLIAGSARAMNCERDTLSEVSGSGAILEMLSGQIYKVDDIDRIDSELWLAAEDVLICSETLTIQGRRFTTYKIINKDSNGEEVSARRLQ